HMEIAEAIAAGRAAVEHLRRAGDLWTLVDALAWLSFALAMSGAGEEAHCVAQEGVELGLKVGHQGGEIVAARGVFFADALAGLSVDECVRRGEEDLARMQAINSPWV